MKKICFVVTPLLAVSFLANCSKQYSVVIPDINGVFINEKTAAPGKDFVTTISVNPELTDEILPTSLTSVKIGDKVCEYAYIPDADFLNAKLVIDKSLITDNINIELSLRKLWYLDTDYLNGLTEDDVSKDGGITQTINVNNQLHTVRLIGIDHDDLADGSGNKAHTTWAFENYICDSNGYSLATPWNWRFKEKSNAQEYKNSNLRKALDGQGNGTIAWYEKGSETVSTKYTDPVIDMLPSKLKGVLKEVKKDTAESSDFNVHTFNTKLFPLSHTELTQKTDTQAPIEGTTYKYYKGMAADRDVARVKHQIKWRDGAETSYTVISDVQYETPGIEIWNYAGFNSPYPYYGGYSWLRSPVATSGANSAFQLAVGGTFLKYQVYMYTLAVAPAFCI